LSVTQQDSTLPTTSDRSATSHGGTVTSTILSWWMTPVSSPIAAKERLYADAVISLSSDYVVSLAAIANLYPQQCRIGNLPRTLVTHSSQHSNPQYPSNKHKPAINTPTHFPERRRSILVAAPFCAALVAAGLRRRLAGCCQHCAAGSDGQCSVVDLRRGQSRAGSHAAETFDLRRAGACGGCGTSAAR